MRYLVSVEESQLKNHPDFNRLTQMGEGIGYRHPDPAQMGFFIGRDGADKTRCYFLVESRELGAAAQELLKPGVSDLKIQVGIKENMPENLRDTYKRFFEELTRT